MPRPFVFTALFILFTVVTAGTAAQIGPERPVSEPVYAPPPGTQSPAAVASDGTDFLAVWSDWTEARGGLYVARVSADGEVTPVPQLALRPGAAGDISACWTGSRYLITWNDPYSQAVMVATVSRSGAVLSEPRVLLPGARVIQGAMAASWRHVFLAYFSSPSLAIKGAVLDSNGALLRSAIPLPPAFTNFDPVLDAVKVASDGDTFALFWFTTVYVPLSTTGPVASSTPPPLQRAEQTFRVTRISDGGDVPGSSVVLGTTGQTGGFGVAFGGGRYVLTVADSLSGVSMLRRIVIDSQTLQSDELPHEPIGGSPRVAWNGRAFVAYWIRAMNNFFELDTVRFGGGPEFAPPPITAAISGAAVANTPLLASNGTSMLAVWMDHSRSAVNGLGGDIFGRLLDNDARAPVRADRTSFPIAYSPRTQTMPALASSGLMSLAVWREQTMDDNRGRLLATRLALDGAPLDPQPIDIAGAQGDIGGAGVAFIGSGFFVIWWQTYTSGSGLYGRLVGSSGSLSPIVSFGGGSSPAIAANASMALITFARGADIVAVRLSPRGEVIDSTALVVRAQKYGYGPRVATNGTDFLVVWTEGSNYWQFPSPNLHDVLGARVTAAGSVDASPIAIAAGPKDEGGPVVASDGRDYLVAYSLDGWLTVRQVLREGQPGAGGAMIGTNLGATPSIAYVRNEYVIAWQSQLYQAWAHSTVSLTHLDRRGERISEDQVIARSDVPPPDGPVLAAAAAGLLDAAYSRLAPEPPFASSMRVFVRVVGDPPRLRAIGH